MPCTILMQETYYEGYNITYHMRALLWIYFYSGTLQGREWTSFGNSQYMYINLTQTFSSARATCQSCGGDLATAKTGSIAVSFIVMRNMKAMLTHWSLKQKSSQAIMSISSTVKKTIYISNVRAALDFIKALINFFSSNIIRHAKMFIIYIIYIIYIITLFDITLFC